MTKWRVYLKDNKGMAMVDVEADALTYDRRLKSWVFRRVRYDDDEVIAVFPESGINGIIRC